MGARLLQKLGPLAHTFAEGQLFKRFDLPKEPMHFKYVAVVDGNANTVSFPYFMLSQSTVFRVSSPKQSAMFWEHWAKPWVHFVPIELSCHPMSSEDDLSFQHDLQEV